MCVQEELTYCNFEELVLSVTSNFHSGGKYSENSLIHHLHFIYFSYWLQMTRLQAASERF